MPPLTSPSFDPGLPTERIQHPEASSESIDKPTERTFDTPEKVRDFVDQDASARLSDVHQWSEALKKTSGSLESPEADASAWAEVDAFEAEADARIRELAQTSGVLIQGIYEQVHPTMDRGTTVVGSEAFAETLVANTEPDAQVTAETVFAPPSSNQRFQLPVSRAPKFTEEELKSAE